jgi:hypothetical protein
VSSIAGIAETGGSEGNFGSCSQWSGTIDFSFSDPKANVRKVKSQVAAHLKDMRTYCRIDCND